MDCVVCETNLLVLRFHHLGLLGDHSLRLLGTQCLGILRTHLLGFWRIHYLGVLEVHHLLVLGSGHLGRSVSPCCGLAFEDQEPVWRRDPLLCRFPSEAGVYSLGTTLPETLPTGRELSHLIRLCNEFRAGVVPDYFSAGGCPWLYSGWTSPAVASPLLFPLT